MSSKRLSKIETKLSSSNRRITVQLPSEEPSPTVSRSNTVVSTSSSYYPPQAAVEDNTPINFTSPRPLQRPPLDLSLRRRPPPAKKPLDLPKIDPTPAPEPFSLADDVTPTAQGPPTAVEPHDADFDTIKLVIPSPKLDPFQLSSPSESSNVSETETPTKELFSGKISSNRLTNFDDEEETAHQLADEHSEDEPENELFFSPPPAYHFQNQSSESDQFYDVHENRSSMSTDRSIEDELYPTEARSATLRVQNADSESTDNNQSENSGPLYRQRSMDSKPVTIPGSEDDEDDEDGSGVSFIAKSPYYTHFDLEDKPAPKMVVKNPSPENTPVQTYDRREAPVVVPLSHSNVVHTAQPHTGTTVPTRRPPPDNPSTGRGARAVSMSTAQPELFENVKGFQPKPDKPADEDDTQEKLDLHKPSLYVYKLRTGSKTSYIDRDPDPRRLPIAIRKVKGQHSRTSSRQSTLFSYQAAIKHGVQHSGLLASEIDDDELPDSKLSHSKGQTKIPQDPDAEVLEVTDQLKRLTAADEGLHRMASVRSVQPPQSRLKLFVANPDE
ncbi:hypothetical protein OGAPHI_004559 [Ogataea philodendri]|uniref:Uncharacterized protein n=1 Tax=Ogataea philodendri TaxID=1378263 RepID=A0A9P8P1R6_9ASCO|nr:uncharacterized protein OGAPHI_004559 [Ogataea philodendri]KAH3664208.1 hypothetical protein OGAPHI_004559 [Ogataea philodendri]